MFYGYRGGSASFYGRTKRSRGTLRTVELAEQVKVRKTHQIRPLLDELRFDLVFKLAKVESGPCIT